MKSSDLKYTINIYKEIKNNTDFGPTDIKYELRCSCRARVNYLTGNKTMQDEEIFYTVDREFIVRSYVPICYTDVIEYDGDYWQVLSIDKIHDYNNIVIRTSRLMDKIKMAPVPTPTGAAPTGISPTGISQTGISQTGSN